MLSRRKGSLFKNYKSLHSIFQRISFCNDEGERPTRFQELFKELKHHAVTDYNRIKHYLGDPLNRTLEKKTFRVQTDILIVGGGAVGSSIAYWLKERTRGGLSVVVVEKDLTVKNNFENLTYEQASTTLSVGGIRQQFSQKENILLSLFGANFLRNINNYLEIPGETLPDINFTPNGYLVLASASGVDQLKENYKLQKSLGCKHEILTPYQLKQRFPWLSTEGIELGCLGLRDEGWFDPYSLLMAFQKKSKCLGAEYLHGEITEFCFYDAPNIIQQGYEPGEYRPTNGAKIRMHNGEIRKMQFGHLIIAAGCETGKLTRDLLLIKKGNGGYLDLEVPIEPRKRYVYCFTSPDGPGPCSPMIIDPSGVYFRPDGLTGNYICGRSPPYEIEPETNDLTVDREYFNEYIWPILGYRVPSFEKIKMKASWAGFYDYNTFDQNAIFGNHPAYHNVHIMAGFSGHGIQQAAAIGKCAMEYLIEHQFSICEMKPFSFDRIVMGEPYFEKAVI